jgi:hypothetical protein
MGQDNGELVFQVDAKIGLSRSNILSMKAVVRGVSQNGNGEILK